MYELCHRCNGELPVRSSDSKDPGVQGSQLSYKSRSGEPSSSSDALLFCPHCGAPQILFPEHMRAETQASPTPSTTGSIPPPRPQEIDWRIALPSAAFVAIIGATLVVLGLAFPLASFVGVIWIMGGAVMALGLYARQRPQLWLDARTGLRIGLVTGLLTIAMLSVALAGTGVAVRFGTHGMGSFDAQLAQLFITMQTQMTARMQEQHQPEAFQRKVLGFIISPEARGGLALFYLGILGAFILLLSAGGGAFAGRLRQRSTGPGSPE